MKPPPFDYLAPASLEEALGALAEHGLDAKPLAGGQSLVPMLNFRLARPGVLVDLNGIEELTGLSPAEDGGLRIGAMARQREAERSRLVRERAPLLSEALPWVGHPQIRNRGTVGGSAAHADPAAELPAVLLALDARLRLRSAGGDREVGGPDFFTGLFTTALEPDELLVAIEVPPPPPGAGWAFEEVARRHGDYALAGVAAAVELDGNGTCRAARVAYVNAGATPLLSEAAAEALLGERPSEELLAEAAEAAAVALEPPEDVHATAAYRRHLARVLTRRVLGLAFRRAGARGAEPADAGESVR